MKIAPALPLVSAILLLSCCTPDGSWDTIHSQMELVEKGLIWERRVPIDIDNTAGTADLFDFPLPVRLTAGGFDLPSTSEGGIDLRFTAEDGSSDIPHEVESWRAEPTGDSLVWVKVPFIAQATHATIWLYYKNRHPKPTACAAAVWSDAYEAVWHLADSETSLNFRDSSGHGRDGSVPPGGYTRPSPAPAVFGAGALYSQANDGFSVPGDSGISLAGPITVTFWAKGDAYASGARLLTAGPISFWFGGAGRLNFQIDRPTQNFLKLFNNPIPANDPLPHRYDLTWTGELVAAKAILYKDGAVFAAIISQADGAGTPGSFSGQPMFVGNWDTPTRAFIGLLDELRIAGTVRTAAWIESQHRLELPGAVTVGAAENVAY